MAFFFRLIMRADHMQNLRGRICEDSVDHRSHRHGELKKRVLLINLVIKSS